MDEFDERIKSAQQDYEPSPGFVDRTMEEVHKHKVGKSRRFGFNLKIWAPAAAGFAVVVFAMVFFVPKETQGNVVDHAQPSTSKAVAKTRPTDSPTPISDGTDDASLAAALDAVQTSVSQSASDQASTDTTINDQTQEISVPTN